MSFFEVLSIAVGLAMDSFSVSICKGLSLKKLTARPCLIAGLWFGGFQAGMTALGYLLGSGFKSFIESVDHWIAFALLIVIGGNMIREAIAEAKEAPKCELDPMNAKSMLGFAVATSIDALAIGIAFSFLDVEIVGASAIIGGVAFLFSAAGIVIGALFGQKYRTKAEIAGGCILILLGVRILLSHLGVL